MENKVLVQTQCIEQGNYKYVHQLEESASQVVKSLQ